MIYCNYTNNTSYNFNNQFDDPCESKNKVGIYPQNQIEKALNGGNENNKWVQFYLPEIIDIPPQKPDMEQIISISSCVEIISQKVIRTPVVTGYTQSDGTFIPGEQIPNAECTNLTGKKLIIEGLLKQKVIYTALVDDQALHSASFCVPFSVFIVVDGDTPLSQKFKLSSYIEDVFICQLSERNIFKNTTIFIKVNLVC